MPTISARRNVADFGQPSAGPGAGVHFLKRHAKLAHQPNCIQHGKCSDAVADKIRSILGDTTPLPSL